MNYNVALTISLIGVFYIGFKCGKFFNSIKSEYKLFRLAVEISDALDEMGVPKEKMRQLIKILNYKKNK